MVAKTEDSIWDRLLTESWDDLDPTAAKKILQIRFGKTDIDRINKLSALARAGELTSEQRLELDTYNDIGRMIGILQSKARLALKRKKGLAR